MFEQSNQVAAKHSFIAMSNEQKKKTESVKELLKPTNLKPPLPAIPSYCPDLQYIPPQPAIFTFLGTHNQGLPFREENYNSEYEEMEREVRDMVGSDYDDLEDDSYGGGFGDDY